MITSCVNHITKWTKMDRNIVCLGPGHRRAPGLAVAALGELSPALLLALCVLNSLGDSPSLSVLKILTALLGDIMIFLTRDILISCLLLLATVLDRLLGALMRAHRLVNSLLHVLTLLLGHTATTLLT